MDQSRIKRIIYLGSGKIGMGGGRARINRLK
jgi:hypothetical protein